MFKRALRSGYVRPEGVNDLHVVVQNNSNLCKHMSVSDVDAVDRTKAAFVESVKRIKFF